MNRYGSVEGAAPVLLMDDVNCGGSEAGLQHCDFGGWGEHDCGLTEVRRNGEGGGGRGWWLV